MTSEKRKRFKNEIQFCAKNTHKNILTITDFGFVKIDGINCPFFVMNRYEKTLRNIMDESIPHEEVLKKFSDILDGIETTHLLNIWHRDLKPENILCDSTGDLLVIADFGIAHFSEQELATLIDTKPKDRLANFQYAAPEQRQKGGKVDHRADIYALGLILNEMFTGKVIQGSGYTTIASVTPNFAYLDQLVEQMTQQNPESRPNTIDEIKKMLIVKQNHFVTRQKFSELQNKVIQESEIDDTLVLNPIELVDVSYQNKKYVLHLSNTPNQEWIEIFLKQEGGDSYIHRICSPRLFGFNQNKAFTDDRPGREQQTINIFKGYISKANENYKSRKEREAREREDQEKRILEDEIRDTERRQQLLEMLKS